MKYIKLFENYCEEVVSKVSESEYTDAVAIPAALGGAAQIFKAKKVKIENIESPIFVTDSCSDKPECIQVSLIPVAARKAGFKPGIYGLWVFYIDVDGNITSEYDSKPGMSYKAESAEDAAQYLIDNIDEFLSAKPN